MSKPVVLGFVAGAITTALGFGTALWWKGGAHRNAEPAGFTVTKTDVVLKPGVPQPIPFETGEVTLGDPLPMPPITARIAAVESRTAPSFAPR